MAERTYLSREAILAVQDIQVQDVEVPEWGGWVLVRGMSGSERDRFEESIIDQRSKTRTVRLANLRAKMVSLSIVDPADRGRLLFSEDDVAQLGRKSAAALQRVFNVTQRLCGLTDDDLEELAKNSSAGQNGGSISA